MPGSKRQRPSDLKKTQAQNEISKRLALDTVSKCSGKSNVQQGSCRAASHLFLLAFRSSLKLDENSLFERPAVSAAGELDYKHLELAL